MDGPVLFYFTSRLFRRTIFCGASINELLVADALSPRPFWVPPANLLLQLLPLLGSLRDGRLQRRTDGGFDQVGSLLPDHDRRGIGIPVHNCGHN